MTAPRTQSAVVVLAIVTILAPVAGVGFVAQPAAAQPAGFSTLPDEEVYASEDIISLADPATDKLNESLLGSLTGVLDTLTSSELDQVMADEHASTSSLQFASDGDDHLMAAVTDNTNHEGRRIAFPASILEDALGYRPGLTWGVHENGTRWQTPVEYEDGFAIIEVPAFSTNTITWSGAFTIETDPSTDGAQFTYDQDSAVGNYTINVTGHENTEWDNETLSRTFMNFSSAVSIAGTKDPTGPGGGSPELEVTGHKYTRSRNYDEASGDFTVVNNPSPEPTYIDKIDWHFDNCCTNTYEFDLHVGDTVYDVASGQTDGNVGDSGTTQMDIANPDKEDVRLVLDTTSDDGDGSTTIYGGNATNVVVTTDDGLTWDIGDLSDGQTVTNSSFDVTRSTTSIDANASTGGRLEYTLRMQEHTETVDPSIQVNQNWTNHTGTLADGSTQSLTANTDWVNQGTNTVNVSVGDGTLSSDAPTPSVDLYYTHDGTDESEVDFTAEKWTESYNVSKTFAQDQGSANLTIPFSANVARIRSIEKSVNGGSFSSVGVDSYTLSGNTLEVDLGAVSAGDEVVVRTDASKVNPHNASITVLDATVTGDANLDTEIQLDSWASDSYLGVGGTEVGKEPHYATSESWSGTEYVVVDADGTQQLHLPDAGAGDTFRARTLPVEVNPAAGTDVRLEVTSTDSTPAFQVRPGPQGGGDTEVEYVYLEGETGKTYELFSQSNDIVRAEATASSPVTLVDDDSEEILEIRLASGNEAGGSGGGGGGGGGLVIRDPGPLGVPLTIIGLVAAVLVLAVATGRTRGRDTGARARSGAQRALRGTIGRVPVVGRWLARVLARAVGGLAGFGRTALLVEPQVFAVGIGVIALFLGLRFGVIELTGQLRNAVVFVGAPALAFVAMRRVGRFDIRVFAAITLLAGVALLETLNPGSIAGPVGEQLGQGALIIALATLFLLYRWWQARQRRQTAQSVAEVLRGGRR